MQRSPKNLDSELPKKELGLHFPLHIHCIEKQNQNISPAHSSWVNMQNVQHSYQEFFNAEQC